jgi:SAM-dependent methyltransferase
MLASRYRVETWSEPARLADGTYAYWNDEAVEADKVWNIERPGGFEAMERYVERVGLVRLLTAAVDRLASRGRRLHGRGADLACGTCWAAPYLFRSGEIDQLYCVEYSTPRLLRFAPQVLEHYGVGGDRITLCLGSFYELRIPDASLDFVFLSQAFHHADRPAALLAEVRRVLKPGGHAILIGEHVIPSTAGLYARHLTHAAGSRLVPAALQRRLFGRTLARKRLLASPADLLAPDPVTGDHYYRPADYADLFARAGFEFEPVRDASLDMQGFLLVRPA